MPRAERQRAAGFASLGSVVSPSLPEILAGSLDAATVSLRPLRPDDEQALCALALDERLWRLTMLKLRTPDDLRRWMAQALAGRDEGIAEPFVIVERASNQVIGSTRFAEIDRRHRQLDLGWTWISPAWQRTAVNTESKLLMLRRAFEVHGCNRVQFKVNAVNEPSRRAVLRLGAVEEATLRGYRMSADGEPCDVVFYSILASEWPAVRERLEARLAAG